MDELIGYPRILKEACIEANYYTLALQNGTRISFKKAKPFSAEWVIIEGCSIDGDGVFDSTGRKKDGVSMNVNLKTIAWVTDGQIAS